MLNPGELVEKTGALWLPPTISVLTTLDRVLDIALHARVVHQRPLRRVIVQHHLLLVMVTDGFHPIIDAILVIVNICLFAIAMDIVHTIKSLFIVIIICVGGAHQING